jgi:hypothetical protein
MAMTEIYWYGSPIAKKLQRNLLGLFLWSCPQNAKTMLIFTQSEDFIHSQITRVRPDLTFTHKGQPETCDQGFTIS